MTAFKLQTTIPVNFNCYILFFFGGGGVWGLSPYVTLKVDKPEVQQDFSPKLSSNQHCRMFVISLVIQFDKAFHPAILYEN